MNPRSILFSSSLLIGLVACSPRTLPSSGRATDGNAYNEDLSAARPVYALNGVKAPSTGKSASPANTTPPVPAPESRKITNVGSSEALHVNRKVDEQLTLIADKNRSIRYASGYRVQIYVGNERQQAEAAKLQVYQNFPELAPYLSYNQPTYKLKVGDFMRRTDAERYFSQIKQVIGTAMLIPDKVDVRRGLLIR
ncbi:MAG: SPOR domain-containing protein [Cytophagales bacterium]|nr:MAG: SPOR domain-containing protein [Cytophagales bacterium]